MMLVILAEFGRRQRAGFGKNNCKYFFAIEGAGTEPRPFRKGKAKMTRHRTRRNADRNENSVKCRMYIDTESRVFLQTPPLPSPTYARDKSNMYARANVQTGLSDAISFKARKKDTACKTTGDERPSKKSSYRVSFLDQWAEDLVPCASEAIDRNSLTANFCIFYANSGKRA